MTPHLFIETALTPALALLPKAMDTPAARAMLLAIAFQESGLKARRQLENGPARGYFQFEAGGGVAGVLTHNASKRHALALCEAFDIIPAATAVHRAIEFHDVLAVCFARLLLWTLPSRLPESSDDADAAYAQYLAGWRPGIPRPSEWPENYQVAWGLVR